MVPAWPAAALERFQNLLLRITFQVWNIYDDDERPIIVESTLVQVPVPSPPQVDPNHCHYDTDNEFD